MKLITMIILLPFVLTFSFFKALVVAIQAFRLGMGGSVYCKHCNKPVHIDDSIFGFCSTECASHSDDVLDIVAHDAPHEAEISPEWVILHNESSGKLIEFPVYIDQSGQIYLRDFSVDDIPLVKLVGHDGYLLQTAH